MSSVKELFKYGSVEDVLSRSSRSKLVLIYAALYNRPDVLRAYRRITYISVAKNIAEELGNDEALHILNTKT